MKVQSMKVMEFVFALTLVGLVLLVSGCEAPAPDEVPAATAIPPSPSIAAAQACAPAAYPDGGAWSLSPAFLWQVPSGAEEVWEVSAEVAGDGGAWSGSYRVSVWLGGREGAYSSGAPPVCVLALPTKQVTYLAATVPECQSCDGVWQVQLDLEAVRVTSGTCPPSEPLDAFLRDLAEHSHGYIPCSDVPPLDARIMADLTGWSAMFGLSPTAGG